MATNHHAPGIRRRKSYSRGEAMKISTIADLARVYNSGVLHADRGQGCGGPGTIDEIDALMDDTAVTQVTEAEDSEAWQIARRAADVVGRGDDPLTIVCVGEIDTDDRGFVPSNPYQAIYAI